MLIEIYTVNGCSSCENIKKLLRDRSLEFHEHVIGKTMFMSEFRKIYPVANIPAVCIDGVCIGGYNELAERTNDANFGKNILEE